MTGPVESREWPNELLAHAVGPGRERRIFGYDVERDLAKHYAFSDAMLLGLIGELPDEARAQSFAIALTFASAMSVGEAPMHAAVLSRVCGVRTGGTLAVAMLALGEHVEALLRLMEPMFAPETAGAPLPEELRCRDEDERASVSQLRELLDGILDVPLLASDLGREAAVVCVLRACGLTTSFQVGSALSIARLPSVLAEVGATKIGDFKSYPMDLPHFEYDPTLPPGGERS
jgi:hypothetical protein